MTKRTPLTLKRRWKVLERDGFRCRYCGAGGEDEQLEVDHVYPVSRGGTNEPGNLVTACRSCNRGKRDRVLQRPPPSMTERPDTLPIRYRSDGRLVESHASLAWVLGGAEELGRDTPYDLGVEHYWFREWARGRELAAAVIRWGLAIDGLGLLPLPRSPREWAVLREPLYHTGTDTEVEWSQIPVRHLRWDATLQHPGGFIEAATGWRPFRGQPRVEVAELARLARERRHGHPMRPAQWGI